MKTDFQVRPLAIEPFLPLFSMSDAELAELGARWMSVDAQPGYPCRVSLQDLPVGERVLLTPYTHHDVESAYRGFGPIFVHAGATAATPAVNEIPPVMRERVLSLRGYDHDGDMIEATVCQGREAAAAIDRLFANPDVLFLHVHNAGRGCYSCRVDRAMAPA